jgi:hypothetical protein
MGDPKSFAISQLRALIDYLEQRPNMTKNERKYINALKDTLQSQIQPPT